MPSSGMDGEVVFMPGVPGLPPGASWTRRGRDWVRYFAEKLGLSRIGGIAIIPPLSGSRRPRTAVDHADPAPFRQQGVHSVKRHLTAFTLAAAVALVQGSAFAQVPVRPVQPAPAAAQPAPAAAQPPRSAVPAAHVAVVDVGYIFKNHARFKAEMDRMKDQVMAAENGLKAEQERIKGLMDQLKGYNPEIGRAHV